MLTVFRPFPFVVLHPLPHLTRQHRVIRYSRNGRYHDPPHQEEDEALQVRSENWQGSRLDWTS